MLKPKKGCLGLKHEKDYRDDPTNPLKEDKIVESEEIEEIDKERSR